MYTTIRRGVSLGIAFASVVLGACASQSVAPAEQKSIRQEQNVELYEDTLHRALDQASHGEIAEAYPALATVIQSPFFDQLHSTRQHATLLVAGLIALDLKKPAEAHAFLLRSSEMPEADGEDWYGRLVAADRLGKHADAVLSLTRLARDWPTVLGELNDRFVGRIVGYAHYVPDGQNALHELLSTLFDARWTLDFGIEPSSMWRDLAALEVQDQQIVRAQEVMSRVKLPHVIIGLRVDRRFDGLREAVPQYFDVDAAVANDIELARSIAQRSPRSLDAVVQLTYALLAAGRYEDVLNIADDVLKKVEGASAQQAPYDDMDAVIWIHDNRARALSTMQRWNEAEAELRVAANMKERGERNVSNIINLAWFYAAAGRNDEALSVLPDLGQSMSPYGLMTMHGARYAAALQKGDMQIANESFEYLRKHRDDALSTWQHTLVIANRLDDAAAVLIERLNSPVLRGEALQDLQDYASVPLPPQRALWYARTKELRDRKDVRRAIEAVGRIETFNIPAPEF